MNEPIKVFLSYSYKDDELREELSSHLSGLAHQKLIEPWQRSPLGKLQAIPRDNQAVASNRDKYARDQPWLQVVKEIGKVA
jgi:hypothetical protein